VVDYNYSNAGSAGWWLKAGRNWSKIWAPWNVPFPN